MIEAALYIADKGKPVFPCKVKEPLTKRGFYDATTDPRRVTAYWKKHPEANIAVPTGERSGFFNLDVDRLAALAELPQELPETLTIRTPSGGLHFCFEHVEGITNSSGNLPDGIDVRGEGGYVLVPPSPGYKIEHRVPIAAAPKWLIELIKEKPKLAACTAGAGARASINLDGIEPIREGCRNNTLTSRAGRCRAEGYEYEEILEEITFVNRRWCEPALPETEVEQIVRSVARYPIGTPRGVTAETRVAIDRYQKAMLHGRAYTRIGDLSVHDVLAAVILKARRFGWLDEDGNVIVSISYRELALEAATRLETAYKAVARAKEEGLLASANAGRRRGQAGAFKLLIPGSAYPEHSDHVYPTNKSTYDGRSVPPLRAPLLRHHAPGYWRLGKGAAVVVHYLESVPGRSATLREIAAALGMRRWRDLYRTGPNPRGRVWRLVEGGVATITGDRVALAEDYLEVIDERREEGGEFAARQEQIRRFNQDRELYHGEPVKPDRAPSEREMSDYQATRPTLVGDAIRAHVAIMNPNTNPGRVYATSYGTDLDTMSGAVAAHFGDSQGDPRAWKRWLDPVAQALAAMDGETRETAAA
jgi:hypothetical protein